MAKLCMGCMNPLRGDGEVCSVCGYNPATDRNPDHCLPAAAVLQGHYIVGRCVGEYGDHLTYLAYDRQLREPCFIQEFFPSAIGRRDTIGGVQPLSGCERVFEEYATAYRNNMRTLARLRELPAVIPVYDIFEENGTVYAASDYCEGMTLTKKIKLSGGRLRWIEARPLFMSLLSSVTQLNEAGVYHLGICPDSILIGNDGKPRLRDFTIPAARQAGTDLTPQLCTGYAAPEQYQLDGAIDARADVYGIAATIFRAVTGNEPPAGNNRAKNSDDLFMPADIAEELTQQVCIALFNALQVAPDSRTATVAELRDQLSVEPTVSALVDEAKADSKVQPENEAAPKKTRTGLILLVVFACCLAVLLGVVLVVMSVLQSKVPTDDPAASGGATLPPLKTSATTASTAKNNQISLDNLVGRNYYDLREIDWEGTIKIKLSHTVFSDKVAGTVISQKPEAGTVVEKGTEVTVIISSGRKNEKLVIPDVSGWKEEHARLYLEALGFRVETVLLQQSNFAKGEVEGTDPAVGTEKLMGDKITLRVSNMEMVEDTTTPPADGDSQPTEDANGTTANQDDNNGGGLLDWFF